METRSSGLTKMDSIQRRIMITSLPDISLSEMDFRDTSFFQSQETPVELPTPAEIMQKYPEIGDGSGIARFDDINLIVKLGPTDYLRLEEVQTMWAMRQVFPNGEIPVPEVFGWRTVDDRHFIYMSLIRGSTLLHAWDHFTDADKECLRDQMKQVVKDLRSLCQSIDHNHNHWIGRLKSMALIYGMLTRFSVRLYQWRARPRQVLQTGLRGGTLSRYQVFQRLGASCCDSPAPQTRRPGPTRSFTRLAF